MRRAAAAAGVRLRSSEAAGNPLFSRAGGFRGGGGFASRVLTFLISLKHVQHGSGGKSVCGSGLPELRRAGGRGAFLSPLLGDSAAARAGSFSFFGTAQQAGD